MKSNLPAKIFLMLAAALLMSLAGCKDFSFFSELGAKGTMQISPSAAEIRVDASITFTASGGNPPYTFTVSGSGTVDPVTGQYSAPPATGTDIVTATDATGQVAAAVVTISLEALAIAPTSVTVPVGSGLTFAATGGAPSYTYDIQTDNSGASIDPSTGEYVAGTATGTDTVRVTDTEANSVTATVTVTAITTGVDYGISGDTLPGSAFAGSAVTGDFTIHNAGTATGTAEVSWWLFISEDGTFGGAGEHLIDSGTVSTDIPAAGDHLVTPAGTWPADLAEGNYDLFIMISSPDDLNHADNVYPGTTTGIAFYLDLPDVDYQIMSVTHSDPAPRYGKSFSGDLELANNGLDDSTELAQWEVWISQGNTTIDAGDIRIDFGTEIAPAMTAGQLPYKSISFSGAWPYGSGNSTDYYLIGRVSSSQDTAAGNDGNNTTASAVVTVYQPQVDYEAEILVTDVTGPTGHKAGNPVSGTFTLTNNGPDDSFEAVEWSVYASTNTTLEVSDWLIDSDTDPGNYAASGSGSIGFSGTWTPVAGSYYLLVKITSAEDTISATTGNNLAVSLDASGGAQTPLAVAAPDVNYTVTSVSYTGGSKDLGGNFTGEFQYRNTGPDDGARLVEWAAYASLDTTLDAGDLQVGSGGGLVPLNGGATSGTIPFSGIWPNDYGYYYLFVEVLSPDNEVDPSDNDDYDANIIDVGYYNSASDSGNPPVDPNGDWQNLVDVDRFGVTLKPGTSVHISGPMDSADFDDIFEFPLDPLTTSVTVTASWTGNLTGNRDVTLWFFIGTGGDTDGFGGFFVTDEQDITVVWEPYTLPGSPYNTVWIDLENSDLSSLGTATLIITAN
jgi:hypothetical protein